MIINHNIAALNTYNKLGAANNSQAKAMEKLSSGLRINRAGDDAAGLAISEKMRGQIRGLDQSQRNAQDGISLIQTAEGALNETHSILQRMRELATQAANDTNTSTDRDEIQNEMNQLTSEINRISNTTEFNTQTLMNASGSTNFSANLQIGANNGQSMTIDIENMGAVALGIASSGTGGTSHAQGSSTATLVSTATAVSGASYTSAAGVSNGTTNSNTLNALSVSTHSGASAAIKAIDNAIQTVSAQRSKLGAFQNRLEHTINNLGTSSENLTAAESRIRDVDMAKEIMNQTKQSILAQASQAMLAQANQRPQGVLQLLG
ncbi:flagellin Hag [Domibacillus enclensis]|uniref:Flagellin n=1 Tax=Domibacillus enclensis TaxID=1017273 RepID=A0A1N6SAI3_9BACI|nr:flagellin Hag [Domibacillus enclensis]OXS79265.1 flagellin [Domibacillus enclensis]SIQ38100.1 flagellin [Domibacillus enclensis]